jgi:phosphoribosylglycinamide formyltransferase 1
VTQASPLKLAVLVSGGGRSLENLAAEIAGDRLSARIELVLSNKHGIGALERCERLGITAQVIDADRALAPTDFSAVVFGAIEAAGCDLVVLAGFLRFLPIPDAWIGRVINIHPSLLPAFGGKGYYGDRVHAAVLERGVQFTGCTVHYVDNEYDSGSIILQRCIPVDPSDDVHSLAARVFEEEKLALPEAIRLHAARR